MKKYTVLHRLLHWIFALGMLVTFITGFLQMFWMGKKAISSAVTKNSLNLAKQNLSSISDAIQEPMFQWHVYFAYVITFAFIIRIIYMVAKGIKFPNPFSKTALNKDRFQGAIYLAFYVLIFVQIITGAILKYDLFSKSIGHLSSTIHTYAVYWMPIFILLHFTGVTISENTNREGITSKMIGGDY
jgi:cytochrome b561